MGEALGRREVAGSVVEAVQGDITAEQVDALVNAANEHLQHGGGVAAAFVKAGGRAIQEESDRWVAEHGPIRTGTAAVTSAGSLAARWIVHTVGPRHRPDQDNEGLLTDAVVAAVRAAADAGARSLALPAISAGIFGYPRREATEVITRAVSAWLAESPGRIDLVRLVGYDRDTARDFAEALQDEP